MPGNLIAVIKEKQDAIAKLQAELDEARALLMGTASPRPGAVARRPQDARPPEVPTARMSGKTASRSRRRKGVKAAKGEIVPTSSVGRTVEILKRAGKPLHVDEILHQLAAEGSMVKKTTLVGNLSGYVNKKRVFNRPAPSVYGLIEARRG